MARVRTAVYVLCLIGAPSMAQAQGIARSFDELRLLIRPGDTVAVTERQTGVEVQGKVVSLSPASLMLTVDGRKREWREGEVATIHQKRGDSLRNGALVGLAIGSIFGGVAAAALTEGDGASKVGFVLFAGALYGGMGAGIGAGVDAIVTSRVVIFERPASSGVAMGIAPMVGRGRAGASVSIRF